MQRPHYGHRISPRVHPAHMRRPMAQEPEHVGIHFSKTELASILISIVTMVFAFQMFSISDPGIIVGVALGITLHEIAHKLVAQSMGFESRYKLWEVGIVMILALAIISRGRFIFAAPGFVVTEGMATDRERGIISLSAPATNIGLAIFFFAVGGTFGLSAAYANVLLAVFNLIPFPPLDGVTVMGWSPSVWGAAFVAALSLGLVFLL